MSDDVTLCVATYRGAARLDRMLSSARANFTGRVVVSDDGTATVSVSDADEIKRVAELYGADLLVSSVNRGAFGNLNQLLFSVTTPIALFIDDDGIYPAELAGQAVALFDMVPHAGMLSWVSRNVTESVANELRGGYEPDNEGISQGPELDTELAAFCSAYLVSTFKAIGGFDTQYRYYFGDSDAAVRLTILQHPCFRIQWPRIPHVEHSTIHVYPELNGYDGKENDRLYFLRKWGGKSPAEKRNEVIRRVESASDIEILRRP